MRTVSSLFGVAFCAAFLVGCQGERRDEPALAASATPRPVASEGGAAVEPSPSQAQAQAQAPSSREGTLAVGLITGEASKMLERYTPLANYVAKATGYEGGRVVIHDSADLVIGKLCDGSLDLVLESVYSVAQAVRSCGAVPLVVAAKGNTYRYHSVVFVHRDSPVKTLSELGGKDILFEDPTSTSGYIVPRMMLEDAGVALLAASEAPRPTAVRYRFGREELNLVGWVVHGLVAAASTADLDLEGFEDADVRVIGKSAPLPRQLFVMGPHVAKERGAKIVSSLVGMGADAATKDILTKAETAGFALLEAHDHELITRLSRRSEVE